MFCIHFLFLVDSHRIFHDIYGNSVNKMSFTIAEPAPTSSLPEALVFENITCCFGSVSNPVGSGRLVLNNIGLEWNPETPTDPSALPQNTEHLLIEFNDFSAQGTQEVDKPEPATYLFIQNYHKTQAGALSMFRWFKLPKEDGFFLSYFSSYNIISLP